MKTPLKLALFALFVLLPASAYSQTARLDLNRLAGLESRARDVVEVNIEGKVLDLAKRVLAKTNEPDAQKVSKAISGLEAIYVRAYKFENENEFNMADVDQIRSQLLSPGWERLANARSKKNNQRVDVFTMFTGDIMSGVAVVVSEAKSIAIVNVIGPIDIEMLAELSGRMNIPKFEIETDKKNKE